MGLFDLFADEREKLTRKVLLQRAREAAGTAKAVGDAELNVWRSAIGLLKVATVVIPWAERLAEVFPSGEVRARRDFPRVLALVEACALLHQRQRPRDEDGRVIATREDWAIVRPLVQQVLGPSMTGINETAKQLAALHDELVGQSSPWLSRPDLENVAAARHIASRNTVHKWAKRLAELGVWEGRREKGGPWQHRRLRDVVKEPIPLPDPESLPSSQWLPKGGGGSPTANDDAGSYDAPTEDRGSSRTDIAQDDVCGSCESESGWESDESPHETRENPSHHRIRERVGGLEASDAEDDDPSAVEFEL